MPARRAAARPRRRADGCRRRRETCGATMTVTARSASLVGDEAFEVARQQRRLAGGVDQLGRQLGGADDQRAAPSPPSLGAETRRDRRRRRYGCSPCSRASPSGQRRASSSSSHGSTSSHAQAGVERAVGRRRHESRRARRRVPRVRRASATRAHSTTVAAPHGPSAASTFSPSGCDASSAGRRCDQALRSRGNVVERRSAGPRSATPTAASPAGSSTTVSRRRLARQRDIRRLPPAREQGVADGSPARRPTAAITSAAAARRRSVAREYSHQPPADERQQDDDHAITHGTSSPPERREPSGGAAERLAADVDVDIVGHGIRGGSNRSPGSGTTRLAGSLRLLACGRLANVLSTPSAQSRHPHLTTHREPAMNSFEAALLYFNRAADQLDLSDSMRRLLVVPKREVQVQVTIELDNGEIATFIGYRVQHDNSRGPMKGGLRYPPPGRSRRSPQPRRADDAQDGGRQHSLRRRQGRHRRQPPSASAAASWSGSPASSSTRSTTSSAPTSTSPPPTWAPTPR